MKCNRGTDRNRQSSRFYELTIQSALTRLSRRNWEWPRQALHLGKKDVTLTIVMAKKFVDTTDLYIPTSTPSTCKTWQLSIMTKEVLYYLNETWTSMEASNTKACVNAPTFNSSRMKKTLTFCWLFNRTIDTISFINFYRHGWYSPTLIMDLEYILLDSVVMHVHLFLSVPLHVRPYNIISSHDWSFLIDRHK